MRRIKFALVQFSPQLHCAIIKQKLCNAYTPIRTQWSQERDKSAGLFILSAQSKQKCSAGATSLTFPVVLGPVEVSRSEDPFVSNKAGVL